MKDLAILIPSWKGADYLPFCLSSIKQNCITNYEVFVILNEADVRSMQICEAHGVHFIALDRNEGTLAVDHAIPYLRNFRYVANLNIDMMVCPSWNAILLTKMSEYNDKVTVSSPAVEYAGGGNGIDTLNDPALPKFNTAECLNQFTENFNAGKYRFPNIISQRHPVICTVEDYIAVRGYSDNWDFSWHPGYTLDFFFPYRLWKERGIEMMVSVGATAVLHDYSSTMNKLPENLKAKNCWDYFQKKTGITVNEFKNQIKFNTIVN